MIKIIKTNIQKFTHILHIADIHIRLNKRHDEYREVFDKFYDVVEKSPETTLVAILGDIFHSKSDLSPECVQMASDFFNKIADLRPTILIAGNHDATLSNKSRLDCLTPLVDALNHQNLYYLKDTGLYAVGNVLFNNMSIFDQPEKYILGVDIPSIYRNQYEHIVALFHGPVDTAIMDNGYPIRNPQMMLQLFDGNDIVLLGDIHRKQDMQEYIPEERKPCIHYPGSMIQQSHGEGLDGHGYSTWDLSTRKYHFTELQNDYGFFTIEIHKGQLITSLVGLPRKVRLRVKCFETIASEVKAIVAKIKEQTEVVETTYVRMDQEKDKKDIIPICKDIVLNDLSNVEYQCKLITEYLKLKHNIVDQTKLDAILDINRNTNLLIKRDEFARNLKWKPIKFEFDNMFTYGEGNVIDFTKMEGVYGIFGPNRSGKSSILSALTFCLFDKFDRGFKGLHVLNIEKSKFWCKLEFEISGLRYFIERTGETTRTGNVKVNVRFWRIKDGVEEELHGNARRDTNEVIRDYIGTYEDFILTTLSIQSAKNNDTFIDMGNSDRKDLLVQFIGLNVFDRLQEAAAERNKELNALLKAHKDKNYAFERNQNEGIEVQTKSLFEETEEILKDLQKQIAEVNEEIIKENQNLIKLDDNVPTNLTQLEDRKTSIETSVRQKKQQIENFRKSIEIQEKRMSELDKLISDIESSDLIESHKIYKTVSDKLSSINQVISLKQVDVRNKLNKVDRLNKHKYDPNCKFCIDNDFVRDAMKAREELVQDKIETDKMLSARKSLEIEVEKYKWTEQDSQIYTKYLNERSKIKDEYSTLSKNVLISNNELEKLETSLKSATQQIELYHRNAIVVQNNEKVNSTIAAYRNALTKLELEQKNYNGKLIVLSGTLSQTRAKIQELTDILNKIKLWEDESDSYKLYMTAVGRDGLPYEVISNTVPEIEKEVNSILSQVVEYTIQFESDGKNIVPYIVYDQRRWPIEMSSGFERFTASIAIRIALTNISNLPKTTFLAIDEGFGVLDSENMSSMFSLFSFLKTNFDFILIVSHVDAMKDAVDKTIEIKKEGNFSKVVFD